MRRETASRYLKAAGIAVRRPGRWGRSEPPKAAIEVSTDSRPPTGPGVAGRSPQASACEPYRELIEEALGRGRTAKAIWQDLVDDHGFASQYASVRRFVTKSRGGGAQQAHPVIVTAAGEEAQVDYGQGPMLRDARSGKYRRSRLFVLTLGYSRKCVRFVVPRSSTQIFAELQRACLSPARGRSATRRSGQSARRCTHCGHLRSGAQSAVCGRARALWSDCAALPGTRSESQRQGRVGRESRAAQAGGAAVRE